MADQIPPVVPNFELQILVDALTAAAPLMERVRVTCRQTATDAGRAADALEKAIDVVKRLQPRRRS